MCAGFDGGVVCSDCMENGSSYCKDPAYLPQGMGPVCLEYQQHPHTPPMEYRAPALHSDTGYYTPPHCNGTPNGVRRDPQPPGSPPGHHDAVTSQRNHHDRQGTVSPPRR